MFCVFIYVMLGCVSNAASLVAATLGAELQSEQTKELKASREAYMKERISCYPAVELQSFLDSKVEASRLAFLKLRSDYTNFYHAHQSEIEQYKLSVIRLNELQKSGVLNPLPQGASDEDRQRFAEKMRLYKGLSLGIDDALSSEVCAKLANFDSTYDAALTDFVYSYAHLFDLSNSAAEEMLRDVDSRLDFVSVSKSLRNM